jgi:hypothetical protein
MMDRAQRIFYSKRGQFSMVLFDGCGCSTMKWWLWIHEAGLHNNYQMERCLIRSRMESGFGIHKEMAERFSHAFPYTQNHSRVVVVRNPYARLLSKYFDKVVRPGSYLHDPNLTFPAFVDRLPAWPSRNWDVTVDWLKKEGIRPNHFDYLVKLEFIDWDFNQFLKAIDLPTIALGNYKERKRLYKGNWRDYYDAELAEKVYGHFRKDFETWGYEEKSWLYPEETKVVTHGK